MGNTTMQIQNNLTDNSFKVAPQEGREIGVFAFLTLSSCFSFLYVNGVMLYTLRSKAVFRETPRYILLYSLLFADTYQLATSLLLFILALSRSPMTRFVCGIIIVFGMVSANVSSLTLAVMSLERYVAVCFPLRHTAIVTIRGTGVAIAVVWTICFANTLILLVILPRCLSPLIYGLRDQIIRPVLLYHLSCHIKRSNGTTVVPSKIN